MDKIPSNKYTKIYFILLALKILTVIKQKKKFQMSRTTGLKFKNLRTPIQSKFYSYILSTTYLKYLINFYIPM